MSCTYRHSIPVIADVSGLSRSTVDILIAIGQREASQNPPLHPPPPTPFSDYIVTQLAASRTSCHTDAKRVLRAIQLGVASLIGHPQTRTLPAYPRLLAIAFALGVPTGQLPEVPPPAIIESLYANPALHFPISERGRDGIVLCQDGRSIPDSWITAVCNQNDDATAAAWIAAGATDQRLVSVMLARSDYWLHWLVRSGVIPNAILPVIAHRGTRTVEHRWMASIPLTVWDRIEAIDATTAAYGRVLTIAALIDGGHRDPAIMTALTDSRTAAHDAARLAYRVYQTNSDDSDDSVTDSIIMAMARDASIAATAIIETGTRDPRLVRGAAQEARTAEILLRHCPDLRFHDAVVEGVTREPLRAARVIGDLRLVDPRLIAAAATDPEAAEYVVSVTDRADDALLIGVAGNPESTARVVVVRPDLQHSPILIHALSRSPSAAAYVLQHTRLSDPTLCATAADDPHVAAAVLSVRPDLADNEDLIAAAAKTPRTALRVLMATSSRDERLVRAALSTARTRAKLLRARPDIVPDTEPKATNP